MRNTYIVSYDIVDSKRRKKVHKKMKGFGQHLQYSVFRCELAAVDKVRMIAALTAMINTKEDQVLVIDLGPADGRAGSCIESIGKKYIPRSREPTVV